MLETTSTTLSSENLESSGQLTMVTMVHCSSDWPGMQLVHIALLMVEEEQEEEDKDSHQRQTGETMLTLIKLENY